MDTRSISTEDMAYELAEYAYEHMSMRELMETYGGEFEAVRTAHSYLPETLIVQLYYSLRGLNDDM